VADPDRLPLGDDDPAPDPAADPGAATPTAAADGRAADDRATRDRATDHTDDGARRDRAADGRAAATAATPSFQASAGIQGRQFAEQCDTLLRHLGFELRGRIVLTDVGVEIDQVAVSPSGRLVWLEYKGSVQGNRPGLRRTDTVKKAVANGALLAGLAQPAPYVVLTSHLPAAGAAAAMLDTALRLGYLADVICLYDPAATARLRRW